MAVSNVTEHPTLSNPEHRKRMAEVAMLRINGHVTLLCMAVAQLAEVDLPDDTAEALDFICKELRLSCDGLLAMH